MLYFLFRAISLVLAALATIVAFGGVTHDKDKPVWHLNFRGISAALCLFASVIVGLVAEKIQINDTKADAERISELSRDLSEMNAQLQGSHEENIVAISKIDALQNEIRRLSLRIHDQVTSERLTLNSFREDGLIGFRNSGSQRNFDPEIEEYLFVLASGQAEDSRFSFPLFQNRLYSLIWESHSVRNWREIQIVYSFSEEGVLRRASEIREEIMRRALNVWRENFDVSITIEFYVCASIFVVDDRGGPHRRYLSFLARSSNSGSSVSILGMDESSFQSCKGIYESVPEATSFSLDIFQHGYYFVQDFSEVLAGDLLTEERIRELGIEFLTKAQ